MEVSSTVGVNVAHRAGTANGTTIPQDLAGYLSDLESWAEANHKDAKSDLLLFWLLKLPAIAASAAAGVLATLDQKTVSLVVGMLASLCVLIDGLQPRGTLRILTYERSTTSAPLTNGSWRSGGPAINTNLQLRSFAH